MRLRNLIVPAALLLAGVMVLAQSRENSKPTSSALYRVTPWPNHSSDQRYGEEVEQHLNQMASEGWRYHSELAGQGAKMMLFERASR